MSEEYKKLTKEQKENIGKYLESRLGIYGVRLYELKWEETPKYSFKECAQQNIEVRYLGIAKHMIRKCTFLAEIWGNGDSKDIRLSLRYEHHDGGSNGHGLNIKIKVHSDASVYEVE